MVILQCYEIFTVMLVLHKSKGQRGKLQYKLQLVTEKGNYCHYVSENPSKPYKSLPPSPVIDKRCSSSKAAAPARQEQQAMLCHKMRAESRQASFVEDLSSHNPNHALIHRRPNVRIFVHCFLVGWFCFVLFLG